MNEENKLKNVRNAYSAQAYKEIIKEIDRLVNIDDSILKTNEKLNAIKRTLKKFDKWNKTLKSSELGYNEENKLILKFKQ